MQMGALVDFQLSYPDMTIRDFFAKASKMKNKRRN